MSMHPSPFLRAASALTLALLAGAPGSIPALAQERRPSPLHEAVEEFNREAERLNTMESEVEATLLFPAGKSPKVFTRGWVFGARCVVNPGTRKAVDITDRIRWKGSGTFTPDHGPMSRPTFKRPGTNTITLYVEDEGEVVFQKTFKVEAVDPTGYARMGDQARCLADAHGCPACPHPVQGPITGGSPNVLVDGIPAARVGDQGTHAACCGPNTFMIQVGDPQVLIDGKPAARLGDRTQHCGGFGTIITAIKKP